MKRKENVIETYEVRRKFYDELLIPILGHMLLTFAFLFLISGLMLFIGEYINETGIEVVDYFSNKMSMFSYMPIISLITLIRGANWLSFKYIKHS